MARTKTPSRAPLKKPRKAQTRDRNALVILVREKVRRFILEGAPIVEFQKAILIATRRGQRMAHPLTGPVFRRIVRDAVHERMKGRKKRAKKK